MNASPRIGGDRKRCDHPDEGRVCSEHSVGERITRVRLAFNELTAEEQRDFADHLVAIMAVGPPLPLTTFAAEAADWASWACSGELLAYAAACLVRLPEVDRRRLLAALTARTAG